MTTTNPANSPNSTWTGMVPVDDTALAVTDTGGPGRPVVYLNGSYADQSHWRRVIAELGSDYRHITYDERARGKSKRSRTIRSRRVSVTSMPSSRRGGSTGRCSSAGPTVRRSG
jgi:pimeloyl-ACP methyl ester carboxylesterase